MISIITITKNNISGLQKTLESVKKHRFDSEEIEHIVIDGLSTDGTEEYLEKCENIKYISKRDSGIYEAMNRGIDVSNGCAIIFLNAGDLLCEEVNLHEIAKTINYKEKIHCFRCRLRYEEDEYVAPSSYHDKKIKISEIVHQSIICPKYILVENKFNEMLPISADSEWKIKVLNKYGAVYREEILTEFELGGVSSSASLKSTIKYLKQSSNFQEKVKHVIKFFLRQIIGQKKMYRLIFSKKYIRYTKQ
jgi:putative colanic acid biosynthesis glycosyltransferase